MIGNFGLVQTMEFRTPGDLADLIPVSDEKEPYPEYRAALFEIEMERRMAQELAIRGSFTIGGIANQMFVWSGSVAGTRGTWCWPGIEKALLPEIMLLSMDSRVAAEAERRPIAHPSGNG